MSAINPKLRALANHLGPAYIRVSGTWANSSYLPKEGETLTAPPEGFNPLLTRDQWRGVVAFAKHDNAKIVTSFPASLKDEALSADWLDRTIIDADFYGALRDRYEPGKPLWLYETAQAACGGLPWASTFLDSFRYLNQLGVLARKGVAVVAHNTLAASDYGIINQDSFTPRPNYWAAVLRKRTIGLSFWHRRALCRPNSDCSPIA